jgi:putative transposase
LVQDERYLISIIRYIHQNPIKAGMCKKTEEYKWSSDVFYRTNNNGFISIDIILDMLSSDRKEAINKYSEYMKQEEKTDYDNVKVVGEEAYKIMCNTKKKIEHKKRLDEILIGQGLSEEKYELIKQGSRRRDLTGHKVNYAREAIRLNYTHKAIGENISISDAAVRNLKRRTI